MPKRISLHGRNIGNYKNDGAAREEQFLLDNFRSNSESCPIRVKAHATQDEKWEWLANAIKDNSDNKGAPADTSNPSIPAGFTYLGQFLAHDLSFSRGIINDDIFQLQLDCLYGFGVSRQPQYYNYNLPNDESELTGLLFYFEEVIVEAPDGSEITVLDVPRIVSSCSSIEDQAIPVIVDARNDEHFIISQLHVLFMLAHNRYVRTLYYSQNLRGEQLFNRARQRLIHAYQRVIVEDYLFKMVGKELVEEIIDLDVKQYKYFSEIDESLRKEIFLKSILRVGHSQVRGKYNLHPDLNVLFNLFRKPGEEFHLEGFCRAPNRAIDWGEFFELSNEKLPQSSDKINLVFVEQLFNLPYPNNDPGDLILRNLRKGGHLNMAEWLIQEQNLEGRDPFASKLDKLILSRKLDNLPLWSYILYEAEIEKEGASLGSIGGRLMAELIIGALRLDETSYLNNSLEMDRYGFGEYQMSHFIKFALGMEGIPNA